MPATMTHGCRLKYTTIVHVDSCTFCFASIICTVLFWGELSSCVVATPRTATSCLSFAHLYFTDTYTHVDAQTYKDRHKGAQLVWPIQMIDDRSFHATSGPLTVNAQGKKLRYPENMRAVENAGSERVRFQSVDFLFLLCSSAYYRWSVCRKCRLSMTRFVFVFIIGLILTFI